VHVLAVPGNARSLAVRTASPLAEALAVGTRTRVTVTSSRVRPNSELRAVSVSPDAHVAGILERVDDDRLDRATLSLKGCASGP
jgi:hypothetical protein